MSDLHCPATVLVASAPDAEHESELPAGADGSIPAAGCRHAERLAGMLADRNVALIYTSPGSRAVRTAELVAARLACAVRVREELASIPPGDGDRASTHPRVLDEIADLHRGETVLVIGPGDVIPLLLPAGVRSGTACAPVELSVDADGWTCTVWPSD